MKKNHQSVYLNTIFLLLIFGFAAANIIRPQRERSEAENRTLAQRPALTWDTLISGRDLNATLIAGKELGLYKIGKTEEERVNLAMPVRHWGKLYEEIIRSVMRGGYKNDDNVFGDQALNYFWGMSSGAVDVIYSRNLGAGQIRLLRSLRSGIQSMAVSPFTGPIYSQDGSLRCADGEVIAPEAVVNIDWLADNIDGYIPTLEEMREDAVELVRIQGIKED